MNEEELALQQGAGEEASQDTTPVSETEAVEDNQQSEVEVATETEDQGGETTGDSRRSAQNRIRELSASKRAAEERARSLEEKLAELTSPVGFQGPQPQFNPQEPIIAENEDISVAELNRRIAARDAKLIQQANANAMLMQKQSEAINRINSEANETLRDYPELNPDSDEYNQELSETITEATLAYVRANPYDASVKKFVGRLMKPYKGAVTKEVGKASENIAKQVSQAALRPNSIRKAEKTAAEKSIAELEAELGVVTS